MNRDIKSEIQKIGLQIVKDSEKISNDLNGVIEIRIEAHIKLDEGNTITYEKKKMVDR